MAESTPQQQRFQEALHADGFSLRSFRASSPSNLLPNNTGRLPEFFEHNLVSPHRVLKHLQNNVHSNIKVFYYQLLRVTYEVQTETGFNTSFMFNLIHIVFHEQFEILFTPESESQRDLYNDFQFKKLFAEFVVMLQNEDSPNVESLLNNYPIMDTVFIHIYRSILASQGHDYPFQAKIPTPVVFSEIGVLLGLAIESYNFNCWKFADSDMFCYEHNDYSIYLAYIQESNTGSEEPSSSGAYSYQSYNANINTLNQYGSGAASHSNVQSLSSSRPTVTPVSNYQSLEQMADRYIVVEPKHDTYEASLNVSSNRNQVKESMMSVTYDFVDFTGQTATYKDRVPKRQALQAQQSSLAQPAKVESKPYSGLDNYLSDPLKPSSSYNVTDNATSFESSYTSNPILSSKYDLPKVDVTSPYQPFGTAATGSSYANAFSESLYSPAIKPTSSLETYNYQPPIRVESKPLTQSYTSYQTQLVVEPYSIARQEQKLTNVNNLTPVVSSNVFESRYDELGDYYNDFTADTLLNSVIEPHRTKVLHIKSRIRGWKKSAILLNTAVTVGRR